MIANKPCRHVQIITPKRYVLDGLWFGPERPKTAVVFVHGLGANAFAHHNYLLPLANRDTAVLFFSNRGHDGIAGIKKIKSSAKKGYVWEQAGVAHEVFSDCLDDLQGAVDLVRKRGARHIFLVGHSTGCQKIVYYLSRRGRQKLVSGVVLLCPISDYASATHQDERKRRRAERAARRLVRSKKPHELLPAHLWRGPIDAQRFLSLYTLNSKEEIFTYAQWGKTPHALRKLRSSLIVILAGDDEYRDRPAEQIAAWFRANLRSRPTDIQIISGASHSFTGKEESVTRSIRRWIANRQ
jgi:alpha-beta hydrolase superfamily lysophospholipase